LDLGLQTVIHKKAKKKFFKQARGLSQRKLKGKKIRKKKKKCEKIF